MNVNLIVADDFLLNPEQVREAALRSDFSAKEYKGHTYQGVGLTNQPDVAPLISAVVGAPVKVELSFFRCMVGDEETTTFIHADNVCAEFAGVIYLNTPEQCRGGTAFWRHKESRMTEWDPKLADEEAVKLLNQEGMDESKWLMESLVGMRFNRFVCYPTNQFHSMYPKENWSQERKDGRLVMAVFFNIAR